MSSPHRLRARVPMDRIEDFFAWIDAHCPWTGYRDDDRHVSFVVTDPTAADRIAEAWPKVQVEKVPLEYAPISDK